MCARDGDVRGGGRLAPTAAARRLHDLAYGRLAFDGHEARSVLEAPGAREVAVELWSPSKIYGMAGWRIGFLVGAAEIVARVQTLIDHTTAGVWTGFQRGLEPRCAATRRPSPSARDVVAAATSSPPAAGRSPARRGRSTPGGGSRTG